MHLIEPFYVRPFSEIAARGGGTPFAGLAFNREFGLAISEDNKVDLSPVGITNEAQLHLIPIRVLHIVAVLQQMPSHHILESRSGIGHTRPVPEIQLLLFRTALIRSAPKGGMR